MIKILKQKKGITLIALVITIIVLLILAGISISMLSGDNSILQRATDAKQISERAEAKEQAQTDIMAYIADKTANHQDASLDDDKVKEILSDNKSYVKEAGDTSFTTKKGEYEIPYSELYMSNNQEDNVSPEIKYGYANNSGVVDSDTLIVGDIINYYYDITKSPIQCEIIYNDESHGLQAISLGTVRNVKLGFGFEGYESGQNQGTKHEDPKAIEAFKNGAPFGYENTDFDKCRWSLNHALATLNNYAQEYLGDMSINVRCVGCPADNIILNEDETTNMVQIGDNNIEVKGTDSNISGSYSASNGYTENISEDLKTLDTLGIVATGDGITYWLCSRDDRYGQYSNGYVHMNVVHGDDGAFSQASMLEVKITSIYGGHDLDRPYGLEYGFRPIFTLKSNMKVEKIGHQDFGAGALEEP